MRKKILILMLSMFTILGSLSGCKLSVLEIGVSTYPVEYLVKRIAKDKVNVVMLSSGITITRAQAINDFKSQLEKLDVFFQMGQLEPYISVHLEEVRKSNVKIIDLVGTSAVYAFKRYTTNTIGSQTISVISDYYDGSLFKAIDMYDTDPYLWIDPITMTSMASTIKKWLVSNYPEEKAFFETNFADLEIELANMDANYQVLRQKEISFISVTPSFGNWQKAYGMRVYPVILSKYGVLPNDQQLAIIKANALEEGVQYIVKDPLMSEDMLALHNLLKTELGLNEIILHSLAFLSEKDIEDKKDYMTLMYENLAVLKSID
ncbi:MAG: ABC transporter metal-binding lipoprotein [Erysipelotrichaceae bacterium]|nr:MAG: ABC transporter metal-binding [Erysipelotrichaceae bacterium]TXT18278.1 MAG: ABC transporter metal-binding lipoprotein [Erysipelotrichaceae bacterium]